MYEFVFAKADLSVAELVATVASEVVNNEVTLDTAILVAIDASEVVNNEVTLATCILLANNTVAFATDKLSSLSELSASLAPPAVLPS